MYDDEQAGWLAGDDYERAAALREEEREQESDYAHDLPHRFRSGRWEDSNPPGAPR